MFWVKRTIHAGSLATDNDNDRKQTYLHFCMREKAHIH
jgi:hypothetical protein